MVFLLCLSPIFLPVVCRSASMDRFRIAGLKSTEAPSTQLEYRHLSTGIYLLGCTASISMGIGTGKVFDFFMLPVQIIRYNKRSIIRYLC